MGANIALLRYYYYEVSFDMKLHANEQSICKLYKLHSDGEQCATVGVLREVFLVNSSDGINVIEYFAYVEAQINMCYIHLYSFVLSPSTS